MGGQARYFTPELPLGEMYLVALPCRWVLYAIQLNIAKCAEATPL